MERERERDTRRLGAALYAWQWPPFKLWACVRAGELGKAGEPATVVIWFNKQSFDALELEGAGEPEYAVRRASGAIERSPNAPVPPEPVLRVVYRRQG
jgi:hypothetical protein